MNKHLIRQAKELQSKLVKAQEELAGMTTEASAGGGMVTVVINGHQNIQSLKISPEAVDPEDVSLLEDLIVAAMNEAIKKSQELAQSHLGALTGNINIPGLL